MGLGLHFRADRGFLRDIAPLRGGSQDSMGVQWALESALSYRAGQLRRVFLDDLGGLDVAWADVEHLAGDGAGSVLPI